MKNTINLLKFLAVIFVLTLVARGTSAATLPRVSLTTPQAAEISETVSGSASVISAGQEDIIAPEGLSVLEVFVGIGQKLSYGESVALFDLEEIMDTLARQVSGLDSQRLKLEKLEREETTDRSGVDSAIRNLDRARSEYNEAKSRADSLPSISSATQTLQAALAGEQQAQDALNNLPAGASDEEIAAANQALTDAKTALTQAQETLAAAQKASNDLNSANDRVEDASAALSKAENDYSKSNLQASDTARQNNIDASVLRLDIDKQEALIAELRSLVTTDGVLLATAEGVIDWVMDDGRKTDGNAVVRVLDGSAGLKAEMLVDVEDAIKLSVGNECLVTTGSGIYYRPTVAAVIFAISAPDDREMVKITLLLPDGEWIRGQAIDAEIILSRASYGMCVPLSALHSDSNGYFIYTVAEKSTVLGIENVVLRIPVNLVSMDDTNAAIEGPLGSGDYVITGSNKNITEGSRVRIT